MKRAYFETIGKARYFAKKVGGWIVKTQAMDASGKIEAVFLVEYYD